MAGFLIFIDNFDIFKGLFKGKRQNLNYTMSSVTPLVETIVFVNIVSSIGYAERKTYSRPDNYHKLFTKTGNDLLNLCTKNTTTRQKSLQHCSLSAVILRSRSFIFDEETKLCDICLQSWPSGEIITSYMCKHSRCWHLL